MFRKAAITCALLMASTQVFAQEAASELVTDRPGFGESSSVVGRGVAQFETGVTLEGDGGARTLTAPLGLVRVGVNDRFEIRLSGDGFVSAPAARGVADLAIGMKYRFAHSERWGLDASVISLVNLPSGSSAMTSGAYDPTLKLTVAKSLPGGVDLSANFDISRVTDGGDVFAQRAYSVAASHDIGGGWNQFAEMYALSPNDFSGGAAWTIATGVTRGIGTNMQVDAEVEHGVAGAATRWSVGLGLVIRTRR